MIRLIAFLTMLVPSSALAQTYPSPEAFKSFPSFVYNVAKSAEKTVKSAEVSLASSKKALALTETQLRKAIDGNDAGELAFWLATYLLDRHMVLQAGTTVITADAMMSTVYIAYHAKFPRDEDHAMYAKWLKEATAYEKTFPTTAGDEALIKRAIARTEELKKEE